VLQLQGFVAWCLQPQLLSVLLPVLPVLEEAVAEQPRVAGSFCILLDEEVLRLVLQVQGVNDALHRITIE
jgi:hypothetical protein